MRTAADDLIQLHDQHYILASSSRIDDRTHVLKDGDSLAVLDRFGDAAPVGLGELGLYHDGTRFLSRLALTIGGRRPLLLSSTVARDNTRLVVDLTNPDLPLEGDRIVPRGVLHVARETLLWGSVCYERIRITNHGAGAVSVPLGLQLDADFVDLFEVRGVKRERRGRRFPPEHEGRVVRFGYEGLDGAVRTTIVACSTDPAQVVGGDLRFQVDLAEHAQWHLETTIAFGTDAAPRVLPFEAALGRLRRARRAAGAADCAIRSSNAFFDDWIERSMADLRMMMTETPHGALPYAGIPWFSAPFGRDAILTALETLWIDPGIARGVLGYLAARQAGDYDDERDEEPGKILHEARGGEMAALGEVPFARYYGSVDATPLFVLLAAAHDERTGDHEFTARLWPHVARALAWMEGDGDPDHDGFIEYARHSSTGLLQQGWKDSFDSVFHEDGSPAEAPIALCEVQAYAYGAYRGAARMAGVLGLRDESARLDRRADALRARFDPAFWCEDLGGYAIALDGAKRPCRVRASNSGHALFTGIAPETRAARVAATVLGERFFTGWGIRTLAAGEPRYNPMSYHNGSVWPHDNAVIAAGLARYGCRAEAARVLEGLFDAALHFERHRTPELFCGFAREPGAGPIHYPLACAPQSWAAGAPFLMLAAVCGLTVDGAGRRIVLRRPVLPECVDDLEVDGLAVGDGSASLRFERHAHGVDVNVPRKSGRIEIVVIK